jgi:hypothetical protein
LLILGGGDGNVYQILNDPLHPNDFLARWYAQSLVAALDPE